MELELSRQLNLALALSATIENAPSAKAFLTDSGSLTWEQVGVRIRRLADILRQRGVRRGSRFGILARNSFRVEELKWAGFWLGAVPVPMNWRYGVQELEYVLADSDVAAVFVETSFVETLLRPEFARWRSRLVIIGDAGTGDIENTEDLIKTANEADIDQCSETDPAIVYYTGGTTGKSKGVCLSHRNLFLNALQVAANLRPLRSDVYLHVTPMFHAADMLATCFMLRGSSHSYLSAFNPESVMAAIEKNVITITDLAPTMLIRIASEPALSKYDLSSLRCLIFGSASMAKDWVVRLHQMFPSVSFCHGYGLTETSPNISMLEPELGRAASQGEASDELFRSCGKPVLGSAVRIVDENGQAVSHGSTGEIIMRGPNVMMGYLNKPEETAAIIRDGWIHTGDIGKLDADGNLYVLDRKKDMIITGGENVYSSEVETALVAHADIEEAAVFAVADDTYGEAVAAAIVCSPGKTITAEAVIAHCRPLIAGYKIPRLLVFIESLPKTPVGKINKVELRKKYPDPAEFEKAATKH